MKKNKNLGPEYFNTAAEIISRLRRSFSMKKKLTVAFILLSSISFSQSLARPTQFDKFISKESIEWAAYVNDTIRFEKQQLNKLLVLRLAKDEIKAASYKYNGTDDANYIQYRSKASIDSEVIYIRPSVPSYDSLGNLIPFDWEASKIKIDTASFTKTDITQLFYIENGKLNSYVAWVSPTIPIITSFGVYLGDGVYFSTCFNFKNNYSPGKRSKNLFLLETIRRLNPDSISDRDKLKELYSRNLAETLWPYIAEGKIETYSVETNTKLKKEEINSYLLKKTRIPLPAYDSAGTVSGFILPQLDFSPEEFTGIEIVQDWYYNHTDNIVFNKIKALYLYAKKPVDDEEKQESIPVLKIVFN